MPDFPIYKGNNNSKTRIQEVNDFLVSAEFTSFIKPKLDAFYAVAFSAANYTASILGAIQETLDKIAEAIEQLR